MAMEDETCLAVVNEILQSRPIPKRQFDAGFLKHRNTSSGW